MKNSPFVLSALFLSGIALFSCSNDDDNLEPVNEEEVINQVNLRFTDPAGNTQTFTWNEGQTTPTNLTLTENTTYAVDVRFLDVSNPSDIEDITEEVIEEADEHFVTYNFLGSTLSLTRAQNDVANSDGQRIGIRTNWTTTTAGNDQVRLRLVHEAQSVATAGDAGEGGMATGGETDVEVTFPITIQN